MTKKTRDTVVNKAKAERVAMVLTSMADGLLLARTSAVGTVKLISSEAEGDFRADGSSGRGGNDGRKLA